MKRTIFSFFSLASFTALTMLLGVTDALHAQNAPVKTQAPKPTATPEPKRVVKSASEWKKQLTPMQFYVLREKGTERAFTSKLNSMHDAGTFVCAGCNLPLFASENKFDSGTGWPSFYKPLRKGAVIEKTDPDGERSEVLCARCDGHLGHVFNDATGAFGIPKTPTGLRYCMNGVCLNFIPKKSATAPHNTPVK
jgi:peptide-methionine (R)-S-oxide reductase